MSLYPDPFSDGMIEADHPFGERPDGYGTRPVDDAYWQAMDAAVADAAAPEHEGCAGPDVPIEECPVCGPALVVAAAEDALEEAA